MGCTVQLAKIFVFVINATFALSGLGLLTMGILYKLKMDDATDVLPDQYSSISNFPILTISFGSVVLLISIFGCCGAMTSNSCLLTTYAVILLVIFLLQIALGIFAFVKIKDKADLKTSIASTVDKVFDKYGEHRELVDLIQSKMKCCGTTGKSYWKDNHNYTIPQTCEETKTVAVTVYYEEGCEIAVYDFINNTMNTMGIVILCLATIEILGAICALLMSNQIKNESRRYPYRN